MSDTTPDNGHIVDRRRVLASLAAACAVHAALLIAFALGMGTSLGAVVMPPVTIDLQAPTGPGIEPSAELPGSAGGPASGAVEKVEKASAPSPAVPAQSQSSSTGSQSSTNGGFVIPTPRAQAVEPQAPASGGAAFREAGGKTGVVQGIPSVPGPATAPSVPQVQEGKGTGSASSSGAGTSAVQRSGTGVLVPGASGSTSGSLDLGQLDKALAAGGAGKGAGRGAGTGNTTGGSSTGGSSTGGSTGSGSGGTGTGGTGTGGSGGAGQGGTGWGSSDMGKGRTMIHTVLPNLPAWVSQEGLALSVKVAFTVQPNGVVSAAKIEQSSGYGDVDASVLEAIRICLFNAVQDSAPAKGSIPYTVNLR